VNQSSGASARGPVAGSVHFIDSLVRERAGWIKLELGEEAGLAGAIFYSRPKTSNVLTRKSICYDDVGVS